MKKSLSMNWIMRPEAHRFFTQILMANPASVLLGEETAGLTESLAAVHLAA